MSYAIVRNEKLTRAKAQGICVHNDRRARDSYRQLQNDFHKYITSKGFELDRGLPVEETGAKHEKIEDLKKITNFENTKKVLDSINLELPEVPDIKDIKIIKLNIEKVENEIIKPKDDLINELYQQNFNLHRELSRRVNLVKKAEKYQKERDKILAENEELHNTVNDLEKEYKNKEFDLEWGYKSKIRKLEKENSHLKKVVNKFKDTVQKFIKWIVKKFDITDENKLVRDFEIENHTLIDAEKQVKREDKEKEYGIVI